MMQLKGLSVGNAKAFSSPQRVPFKDVNLVYGGNSAGKSTIMHALLMLKQSCERGFTSDRGLLDFRGASADLGSFRTFIHNHDTSDSVYIELEVDGVEANNFFRGHTHLAFEFGLVDEGDSDPTVMQVRLSTSGLTVEFIRTQDGRYRLANAKSANSIVDKYFLLLDELEGGSRKNIPKPEQGDRRWLSNWIRRQPGDLVGWIPSWPPSTVGRAGRPIGGAKGTTRNQLAETLYLWWWNATYEVAYQMFAMLQEVVHVGPLRELPQRVASQVSHIRGIGSRGERLVQHLARNKSLLSEVNVSLGHLEIPYRLEIQEYGNDDIIEALGDIGVAVLVDTRTGVTLSLADVGFGISQVLPVIVHLLGSRGKFIMIEQPEIHLHPRLQARMADLLVQSATNYGNTLFVETHSEHLLTRIERRVGELKKVDAQVDFGVFYVSSSIDGSIVHKMRVDSAGKVIDPWPDGFFDDSLDDILADF